MEAPDQAKAELNYSHPLHVYLNGNVNHAFAFLFFFTVIFMSLAYVDVQFSAS
jgi:hypothetical protein